MQVLPLAAWQVRSLNAANTRKINTAGLQNNQLGGNGQAPASLDIVVANEQCFGEVFWGVKT